MIFPVSHFSGAAAATPPARVQSTSGVGTAGSCTPSNWGVATTTGNMLVACVYAGRPNAAGAIPTITPPAGWTVISSGSCNVSGQQRFLAAVYVKANAASESNPAAWASSAFMGSGFLQVVLIEWSGCLTSSPQDATGNNTDNSGTAGTSASTGTSGTTAQASEVAIGLVATAADVTSPSAASSFTVDANKTARCLAVYKVISSIGTPASTVSWTTSSISCGAIATFKGN